MIPVPPAEQRSAARIRRTILTPAQPKETETSADVKLIEKTPSDSDKFTDTNIERGLYSEFLYKFDEYPHIIPIADLPGAEEIPAGAELEDQNNWVIRDAELAELEKHAKLTDLAVTGTTYGTGNTVMAYKAEGDNTNTYHLYAKVKLPTQKLDLLKVDSNDSTRTLPNAVFTLRRIKAEKTSTDVEYESDVILKTETTNEEGKISFSDLSEGYYEIRETVSPTDYVITGDPAFYIFVDAEGVSLLQTDLTKNPNEWTKTNQNGNVTFTAAAGTDEARVTVTNQKGAALPHTGGIGREIYWIVGSMLAAFGSVLLVRKYRV